LSETLATWVVRLLLGYLAAGMVFAVPFVLRGVGAVDPVAAESTRGFRLIIVPGVIALWPLLLRRWIAGAPRPVERTAHREAEGGSAP
jgi:hypothetical protein